MRVKHARECRSCLLLGDGAVAIFVHGRQSSAMVERNIVRESLRRASL